MFDRIIIRAGDQHHSHFHEVHEHRAPTDESIRLYKEMEEKALNNILQSVRVMDASVDCVVHHVHDHMHDQSKFILQYRVNGRRVRLDVDVDMFDVPTPHGRMEKVARTLVKALSESIAVQMLSGVSNDLAKIPWSHL